MALTSSIKHQRQYIPSRSLQSDLADIKVLLGCLRKLEIAQPIKRRMLVHGLWQIAIATGNTQSSFFGRYRSEGVIRETGLKIERDHIYRKENLIEQLLEGDPDLDAIIARAQCCVVTQPEHDRLGAVDKRIDGWERYRVAGITVYDMAPVPPRMVSEFQNV